MTMKTGKKGKKSIDPTKAAALGFEIGKDNAPRLLAKGTGSLAETLLLLAAEHGIPVVRDAPVADFLQSVPEGKEIPDNLFRAVASIFAMLYKLEGKSRTGKNADST